MAPKNPAVDALELSDNQVEVIRQFEADYNTIDGFLRNDLDKGPEVGFSRLITEYSSKHPGWRDGDLLRTVAKIRNLIIHNRTDANPHIAIPAPAIALHLRLCRERLLNPARAIPTFQRKVESVSVDDTLMRVLTIISERDYSQFPVYEEKTFCGLLTENGVTRWLAQGARADLGSIDVGNLTVGQVLKNEERRENCSFVAANTLVDDIRGLFSVQPELEAVLISDDGEQTELLRGIATRWDIIHPGSSVVPITAFDHYIGIDYSGAETPASSLSGLRIYQADRMSQPIEVQPPQGPRRYWTRRGVAEWLLERLREDRPTLVGIDHGFSFPLQYFQNYRLLHDWPAFLDDFQRHWPTDQDIYVDFVRNGVNGDGAARSGNARWRRLTEQRTGTAKSVFHFDVPGSVAKATHAGLPWLRYIRQQLGAGVHFWPFDGWRIPAGKSAIVEVYPSLWSHDFRKEGRNCDQHDAYSIAAWMRRSDLDGSLAGFFDPCLPPEGREIAEIEGWILGVR